MSKLEQVLLGKNLVAKRSMLICDTCHKSEANDDGPCVMFHMKLTSDAGEIEMREYTKECVAMYIRDDVELFDIQFDVEEFSLLPMLPFVNRVVNAQIYQNLVNDFVNWQKSSCDADDRFNGDKSVRCAIKDDQLQIWIDDLMHHVTIRQDMKTTFDDMHDVIELAIREIAENNITSDLCMTLSLHCTMLHALLMHRRDQ